VLTEHLLALIDHPERLESLLGLRGADDLRPFYVRMRCPDWLAPCGILMARTCGATGSSWSIRKRLGDRQRGIQGPAGRYRMVEIATASSQA